MPIHHTTLALSTSTSLEIQDVTPQIQTFIDTIGIRAGQVLIFSRHTTTALAINEFEDRLLTDIAVYLKKLAPAYQRYWHNDLHLRDVTPGEPRNAHAHLMAMTLSTSEVVPIVDGQLALGTYQSVLFCELDGPRERKLFIQATGDYHL